MVRGFWGDIVQSPFIPFGIEIWKEPEKTMFKKQINFQQVYSSADFSLFNAQYYITKLEDMTEYHFPFTRIKQVEKQLETMADGEEEEEKKTEEVKSAAEEEKKQDTPEDIVEKLKKPAKTIDLN